MTTQEKIEDYNFYNELKKLKSILTDLNAGTLVPSEDVLALGTTTPITAVPASFADEAAVRTYLISAIPIVETRLDNIEAKLDELITKLKEAGIIKA